MKTKTFTLDKNQINRAIECISVAIKQNAKARDLTTSPGAKSRIQNEISKLTDLLKIFTQQ